MKEIIATIMLAIGVYLMAVAVFCLGCAGQYPPGITASEYARHLEAERAYVRTATEPYSDETEP